MKSFLKYTSLSILFAGVLLLTSGCESYLDKSPNAGVTEEDIFRSYESFQGFVDPLYYGLIPYLGKNWSTMDIGDDTFSLDGKHAPAHVVTGNYWWFVTNGLGNLFRTGTAQPGSNPQNDAFLVGFWDQGWQTIRRANVALAHMDMLTDATEEERNLLLGQCYFMRAWSYFEIARVWGGLPYMEKPLSPSDDMKLPRLSMEETFLKIAADFKEASNYLPWDWNETAQGQAAPNSRHNSPTRGAALAMYSRVMLYVASPWIKGLESRNPDYQEYNLEYCRLAAEAAWEVINSGRYSLVPWEKYLSHFASGNDGSIIIPTSDEVIMQYRSKKTAINGDHPFKGVIGRVHATSHWGGQTTMSPPCAFTELFETANGLAIKDDPTYDDQKPFSNRDPRYRTTFLFDNVKFGKNAAKDPIVHLYTEGGKDNACGNDRVPYSSTASSYTGFIIRKYQCFAINNKVDNSMGMFAYNCPFIRLAEMYLNYAEAMNEIGGPDATLDGASISAKDAINTIRRRVKLPVHEDITKAYENETWGTESLPDVDDRYLASKETFRDRIRNERTVELAYEGHRFSDIRRWHIAHKLPKEIEALDFKKGQTNFRKRVLMTKVFDYPKHYLFPFDRNDVQQYAGFNQNPGWE